MWCKTYGKLCDNFFLKLTICLVCGQTIHSIPKCYPIVIKAHALTRTDVRMCIVAWLAEVQTRDNTNIHCQLTKQPVKQPVKPTHTIKCRNLKIIILSEKYPIKHIFWMIPFISNIWKNNHAVTKSG